jgi:hypothetical protein
MSGQGAPPASLTTVSIAFFSLVTIQVVLALSYKAAQDSSGRYLFSPASILVLAEFVKCMMAAAALFVTVQVEGTPPGGATLARARAAWVTFRREALETCGGRLPLVCAGLALFYSVNNNLMFYVFRMADGANVNLVKSGATFVSALIMWRFLGRAVSKIQWAAILIQSAGLVVTQFGAKCSSGDAVAPLLHPFTYALLAASLTLTSFSGVWNDKIMKDSAREGVSINTISVLLYAAGAVINTVAYALSSAHAGTQGESFFKGLGTPSALLCLLCNSLIGIAVTAVYKYADAVVKTLAGAFSTSVLFFVSAFFFGVPVNVVVVAGCVCIFTATYLYVTCPVPAAPAPAGSDKVRVVTEDAPASPGALRGGAGGWQCSWREAAGAGVGVLTILFFFSDIIYALVWPSAAMAAAPAASGLHAARRAAAAELARAALDSRLAACARDAVHAAWSLQTPGPSCTASW